MNTERWNDIWKIIESGCLQFDQSNTEILCIICTKVLINAHSGPCGCRYCLKCITQYLNEEERICPGTTDYCQDELISINRNIHPDQPMNQRILDTTVKCPHQNCEFTDKLRKIEDHIRICDIQSVKCPYLDVGCKENNLANTSLKNHMLLEIVSHSKLLFEFLDNLKNEIKIINENNMRLEDSNRDLQTCVNDLQIKHEYEYKDLKEILMETENKFQEEKENGFALKKEVYRLNEELESLKKEFIDIKKCVNDSKLKYESENREIKENLTEIKNDLIEERENVEEITKEVKMINDERELMKQVVSENKGEDVMDWRLSEDSKLITILLLGETGVGKSTWINGFVNYLTYDSFADAERGEPINVIPARFTMTDSNFQDHTITYGIDCDTNESSQIHDQSSTQMPKSYLFDTDRVKIRIIDTPGMGDVRGIEKDKENMHNIMAHLSHYKKINGIIILMKPNTSGLTVMFECCMKELLTHLHKDACNNILICFTNGRSTFYRPGETMRALDEFLTRQSIDIKLNEDKIFCMDNECVRYLMARNTTAIDENEREAYATSWAMSKNESKRMISRISYLRSHSIENTLLIYKMRRSIIELSKPMALIAKVVQTNIDEIKDKQEEAISVEKSKTELVKYLKVPVVQIKSIKLEHPRTVCTAPKCIDLLSVGAEGKQQAHYKTICHDKCTDIITDQNVIRSVGIQKCWAMQLSIDKCRVCSCPWDTHMCITYDSVQETVMVEDEGIKRLVDKKEISIKVIREYQKQIEGKLTQMQKEKNRITNIIAIFAYFLKHNSIAPSHDLLMDYLDHLIEDERMIEEVGARSRTLEGLINLKDTYQEEMKAIEEAMKMQSIDVNRINELMLELVQLPNIGPIITEEVPETRTDKDRVATLNESLIVLPRQTKRMSNLTKAGKTLPGTDDAGSK